MAGTDTNKVTINVNGTDLEFTKIGNILGPSGKDGIDGKSIYAKTVDPWSVSGWNPAVAGDLFLNTTTGILWSAKVGAVTSNVKSNWTKVGELAGKITVDSALSSTSTNPVQNKVIKSALDGKAGSSHSHSSLTNSSGRIFNVPTGGSGGEQKTLVITDDLNAYQPAGNYANASHEHPISDITGLYDELTGMTYVTDSSDNNVQLETYGNGNSFSVPTKGYVDSALNGKSNLDHNHDSVYQAKGDYATNDTLKSYVTGTTFIDYTTYIEGEVNKKANANHSHDISNITGLQSALDGKSNTGHGHTISNITNLQSTIESIYSDMGLQDEAIAGKADSVHTHEISNINGLQSALDGKSGVGHTHTISDVAGLKTTLDGKANSSHTHSYLPLAGGTLTGTLGFKSNYLIKPVAEFRTQDNTFTGAITIALPAGISNTMVSMWIDVYNYVTNTSFSVHVGGYTYENNTWQHNPFAMVYGANHTVRLGHNGTNFVIYIGETNSTWSYPQISVRNVILGYAPAYDNWKKDWGISFVTSFSNVSAVINNYAWTTKNFTPPTSLPANGGNADYANSAGNADTLDGNHAGAFAKVGAHNDLTSSGNEFTFASSGFSGAIYLNWRTAGGTNGNITDYILGNGAGGQLGTIIHSGNIGSQSVNYANSAGSARASNISMSSDGTTLTITYS